MAASLGKLDTGENWCKLTQGCRHEARDSWGDPAGRSVKIRVQAAPWALQKLSNIPLGPAPHSSWELAAQQPLQASKPLLVILAPTLHLWGSWLPGVGQRKTD